MQFAHAVSEDMILGTWINSAGDGIIEITLSQNEFTGIIINSADDKREDRKDINNPESKLRNRPLLGVTIISGLSYAQDNLWSGGTIYDPNNGKTYNCKLSLNNDGSLNVRGYAGISLFGRTELWKRVGYPSTQ